MPSFRQYQVYLTVGIEFASIYIAQAANVAVCAAVADKYEAQVNRYGYSLRNIMLVRTTDLTRDYLLHVN